MFPCELIRKLDMFLIFYMLFALDNIKKHYKIMYLKVIYSFNTHFTIKILF